MLIEMHVACTYQRKLKEEQTVSYRLLRISYTTIKKMWRTFEVHHTIIFITINSWLMIIQR